MKNQNSMDQHSLDQMVGNHLSDVLPETPEALCIQLRDILWESAHLYRVLFEGVREGLIVIDPETMKVVLCNQLAGTTYGFDSPEDALGVNPLDFVHPDDRERALTTIMEEMFDKDLRQPSEFRTIGKYGEVRWVSAVGTRIEYRGELLGLVSFRDITLSLIHI